MDTKYFIIIIIISLLNSQKDILQSMKKKKKNQSKLQNLSTTANGGIISDFTTALGTETMSKLLNSGGLGRSGTIRDVDRGGIRSWSWRILRRIRRKGSLGSGILPSGGPGLMIDKVNLALIIKRGFPTRG